MNDTAYNTLENIAKAMKQAQKLQAELTLENIVKAMEQAQKLQAELLEHNKLLSASIWYAIQYAQTVAAEQQQMFEYLEWLQENHPDNEVFQMHGADDGGVIAWQTGYLWDDFMESVK